MSNPHILSFEKMLASGKDNALLRFSLGNEYLKIDDPASAIAHLRQAVILDANYSAAWKLLGRALTENGDLAAALTAYQHGVSVAEAKGDKQAAKEMAVFAKRIEKQISPDS